MALCRRNPVAFLLLTGALLAILAPPGWADDYARLVGAWTCDEDGTRSTLEFLSTSQLRYNGETTSYELMPNAIVLQEEYGAVPYYYELRGDTLVFVSPDGSVGQCRKAAGGASGAAPRGPATGASRPGSLVPGPDWPPYERPAGAVSEDAPSPQALLYKFAGRWDHATSSTLTNLYLRPDGTYEVSYEAGFSGEFRDQSGHQTGNWGAAGSEQDRGRWMIEGSLKQGLMTLIDQTGNRTVHRYEVHAEGGEYYWGEYYFDGRLYSVKYIYR